MNSSPAGRPPATTVPQVLDLILADPGRPRLTWYGDDGERVELSGAVLQNWVSKTVNLLVEEFDTAPGTVVALDLPVHWRGVLWALAAWRCGATVTVTAGSEGPDAPAADVVVTSRPAAWTSALPAGADVVAVALPALARSFDGELPEGSVDAAAAVMTYGDVIGWAPDANPSDLALVTAGDSSGHETGDSTGGDGVTFTDLVPVPDAAGARTLVDGGRPAGAVLRDLLGIWAGGGSVVLTSARTTAELAADPARLSRLRESERVTAG